MTNKEKNLALMESYLLSAQADELSEHTIRSYRTGILEFLDFYGDRDFLEIDFPDADDFKNYLHVNKSAPNTIALRISAMRSFSRYVRKRVRKTTPSFENVFAEVTLPPKKNVRENIIWTDEELINLADLLWDKGLHTEACLVALDVYSGRRRTELRSLRVEDFSSDKLIGNGAMYKTDTLKTKGRHGGKFINCYIDVRIKKYIDEYMQISGVTEGLLFANVTDSDMGTYMKHINKYTTKHFHWHVGRHTFATTLYDNGVPDDIIVDIVGWSNKEMLKVYNNNSKEQRIAKFLNGVSFA